jgi:tRNA threonylcarbamoyladenosine biosynthesis protein TsaB
LQEFRFMPDGKSLSAQVVLAIDTSSAQASFALQRGQSLLACIVTDSGLQHSQTFFGHLESLLKLADVTLNEVQFVSAVTGPGSFTGLRVGLAAALGLAQTLQVTAVGLSTIDAVALAVGACGRVLVVQAAGRDEVFIGLREIEANGFFIAPKKDVVGKLETALPAFAESHWFSEPLVFTGSAVSVHQAWLAEWASAQGIELSFGTFIQRHGERWQAITEMRPLALTLANFVAKHSADADMAVSHPLQACYIRLSDAEMKAAQ